MRIWIPFKKKPPVVSVIRFSGTIAADGRFGSGKVLMKPPEKGQAIIAAGSVRAVMEAAGVMDISVKCLGSRNPNNLVRSTLEGLYNLRSNEWISRARGKDVEYLSQ